MMGHDIDTESSDSTLAAIELREWMDSLDHVINRGDPQWVNHLLESLSLRAQSRGIKRPFSAQTPYINTIAKDEQPGYPGNREIERRIKSIIRWNAMAMVVRANRVESGIGGHISTYASIATLYEVGFNHFFKGPDVGGGGDSIYFQGHAAPGNYARAFLEGRLSVDDLKNFRHEVHAGGGLPSYPHPRLKPEFWQFATVSMGLGPIMAIYQARFNRYLEDRGLIKANDNKIWCFMGDGESDEPESLGAISLASREKLDNLIFVINCNLQRLDGPVRGNGSIIQELETVFRGAGWNVIKVVWGSDWDELFAKDSDGLLVKRMGENIDGERQKYIVKGGEYIRKQFFGKYPQLLKGVEHLSDEQLWSLRVGGHDPEKVYAAYKKAVDHKGSPTVILARTIKGYGLGEAGEGKNITHQQKKMNEEELKAFRTRFGIPISDEDIDNIPFYKPADDSPEITYLKTRRKEMGGFLPSRNGSVEPVKLPPPDFFEEFYSGSGNRKVTTTMVFVRLLSKLLRDKALGKLIVPIVPDESRTFGMEALFRQVGIYSHAGQLYEPVDRDNLLYYREAKDGQILEEGITESGSMSTFIAAGTAYATHGVAAIPFFVYYSMFGLQRIGDLLWAAGDMRARGFLVGATSGRTTLAGEGLQHQDGNSHLFAFPYPHFKSYDPAYAYELAVIVRDGLHRMYENQEDLIYYITVTNENYSQPAMPEGVQEGIIKGMYLFRSSGMAESLPTVNLMGSGAIMNRVLEAAELLEEKYKVAVNVYSVTSYKELHYDALQTERWNILHPEQERQTNFLETILAGVEGVFVAATDYVKTLPESISKWLPGPLISLGTDGFGRSDGRRHLRRFFEVDAHYITLAALYGLAGQGRIDKAVVKKAIKELAIDPEKINPLSI
jgi:pyruvate dehydrogenase E1 component